MATGKRLRGKQQQSTKWKWDKEQTAAFETLKDKLTTPPILKYPDFSLPFELHTDACGTGLGAVLCQKQHGYNRVIAYASTGLSKSEKNYPTHKLNFSHSSGPLPRSSQIMLWVKLSLFIQIITP